jgi:hypothetical protein
MFLNSKGHQFPSIGLIWAEVAQTGSSGIRVSLSPELKLLLHPFTFSLLLSTPKTATSHPFHLSRQFWILFNKSSIFEVILLHLHPETPIPTFRLRVFFLKGFESNFSLIFARST